MHIVRVSRQMFSRFDSIVFTNTGTDGHHSSISHDSGCKECLVKLKFSFAIGPLETLFSNEMQA